MNGHTTRWLDFANGLIRMEVMWAYQELCVFLTRVQSIYGSSISHPLWFKWARCTVSAYLSTWVLPYTHTVDKRRTMACMRWTGDSRTSDGPDRAENERTHDAGWLRAIRCANATLASDKSYSSILMRCEHGCYRTTAINCPSFRWMRWKSICICRKCLHSSQSVRRLEASEFRENSQLSFSCILHMCVSCGD